MFFVPFRETPRSVFEVAHPQLGFVLIREPQFAGANNNIGHSYRGGLGKPIRVNRICHLRFLRFVAPKSDEGGFLLFKNLRLSVAKNSC